MTDKQLGGLLAAGDPPPVERFNRSGASPFFLTGDHAGNAVPRKLAKLGLAADALDRHIAWDIGVRALGLRLAERLDAAFIAQRYSRLVIDCNRDPDGGEAILPESDGIAVPGNAALQPGDIRARIEEIHAPYHRAIAQALCARSSARRPTVLIALHSFTPHMAGEDRPWSAGVLHAGRNDAFAHALLKALQARGGFAVGDNQPYRLDDTDHSIPRHAFLAGLPYAEIEIRQDLLGREQDVGAWADLLASAFETVWREAAA